MRWKLFSLFLHFCSHSRIQYGFLKIIAFGTISMAEWIKVLVVQTWQPEFHPWNLMMGEEKVTPETSSLTYVCTFFSVGWVWPLFPQEVSGVGPSLLHLVGLTVATI